MSTRPGVAWFKSSYSGSQSDDCVEVAIVEQAVFVRDSNDMTRPHFAVLAEEWLRVVGFVTTD
ncbi:DUF397 domain-containing protein [Streptomyces antibioticus]|uniref:DUF397 domain-containing protein n=1 Tax=Streptomyces antibioticus TaxID=1890 RepID=UPI0036B50E1D